MVFEVGGHHFNVGLLVGTDLRAADLVEDVAYALEVVAYFFNDFGFAVLASFKFGGSGCNLSLCGSVCSEASVEFAAESIDACVEGVDFRLVLEISAFETFTEFVVDTYEDLESGCFFVIGGRALAYTGVAHIPDNGGTESKGKVFGNVEVEVEACFRGEEVVVTVAIDISVSPACTGLHFHVKKAAVAFVTAEEVEEVDSTVSANIRVVNSCFGSAVGCVDVGGAFNTESECGRDLFLDADAKTTTHITDERRAIIERRDAATFNTYRPIRSERRSFQCLLSLSCHHTGSCNGDKE